MRTLLVICCAFTVHAVVAGPLLVDGELEIQLRGGSGERSAATVPPSRLIRVIRIARAKRSDDNSRDEVSLPPLTRHAKHRRRRRCRNRAFCLRGASGKDGLTGDVNAAEVTVEREISALNQTQYDGGDKDITEDDERFPADELDPEQKTFDMDWLNADDITAPSVYMGDRITFQENLSLVFTKLLQSLRNGTMVDGGNILKGLNFVNDVNEEDPCQKWLNSRDKFEEAFADALVSLPACPCEYPSNIFYEDKIWDQRQQRHFRWRDVSGDSQRLDVYKPGAAYCVRSLLTQGGGSAAAQHCCYDRKRKLLTRGSGAGTPNFVSPEISSILHERIDVLPWRLCKGDFSRYNRVKPPNNDNDCEANPDNKEYQRQINNTKYY